MPKRAPHEQFLYFDRCSVDGGSVQLYESMDDDSNTRMARARQGKTDVTRVGCYMLRKMFQHSEGEDVCHERVMSVCS